MNLLFNNLIGTFIAWYKYRFKLLYEISVFMRPVKVRKTKSLKLSSAAARP